MANEAVILELPMGGGLMRFTVANGTSISGGTLLKLADPKTASATTNAKREIFAGIATADKLANDGATSIGAYTYGTFDLTATGVINVGALVCLSGANTIAEMLSIAELQTAISGGNVVGRALETATDGEVIAVAVGAY